MRIKDCFFAEAAESLPYSNEDLFWQKINKWNNVSVSEFSNNAWQLKNTIVGVPALVALIKPIVKPLVIDEITKGFELSPMNIRLTPYILSLVDWENPDRDVIRKQFIPFYSEKLQNHPFSTNDPLHEESDSPVPLLTHRYPDKALFLPLTVCPVYCNFCTRSRLIGGSTNHKEKPLYGPNQEKWEIVFNYISQNTSLEDIVISGGDSFMLSAKNIEYIGKRLLAISNIKRIRFATKGLSVLPMKIVDDHEWVDALKNVNNFGRSLGKEVCVHTHFNHPNEITEWTAKAMSILFALGIKVRNQSVFLRGVNNDTDTIKLLIKKLSNVNIQPYYIYLHDMIPDCEHFRTTLREAINIGKNILGYTAGFNTPTIVCDLPGGGGKQPCTSYEYYDEEYGVSIWGSPTVKPGKLFYHFDPIDRLSTSAAKKWMDEHARSEILDHVMMKHKNNKIESSIDSK